MQAVSVNPAPVKSVRGTVQVNNDEKFIADLTSMAPQGRSIPTSIRGYIGV